MNLLKSIGAVVAGFVTCFALAIAMDVMLVMAHVFPDPMHPELFSDGQYAVITFYTAVFSAAGAWLTAKLAPSKPMSHAIALGVLGFIASSLGAYFNWAKAAGHEWYPIALIVIAIPSCWFGGWFYMKRSGAKAAA
jgi:hypothetical protein